MRIVASPETVSGIRDGGGLLFVWRAASRGPRLVLTILVASLDPPPDALTTGASMMALLPCSFIRTSILCLMNCGSSCGGIVSRAYASTGMVWRLLLEVGGPADRVHGSGSRQQVVAFAPKRHPQREGALT